MMEGLVCDEREIGGTNQLCCLPMKTWMLGGGQKVEVWVVRELRRCVVCFVAALQGGRVCPRLSAWVADLYAWYAC